MSPDNGISAADLKIGLLLAADRVCDARDELCALDAVAGDGDLGATLATGFVHVRTYLEESDEQNIGALFAQMGLQLARKAPSTIGTLLATGFIRAGKDLDGIHELDAPGIATLFAVAAEEVAKRGGAAVGERTVLDAMEGAATAAASASELGLPASEALRAAAAGARGAAEATAEMEPRHGRAGWIPERARGVRDAGAVAWSTYVTGLAEGVTAVPGTS